MQDKELIATGLTGTSLQLDDLRRNGTLYPYEVVAVNAQGEESAPALLRTILQKTHTSAVLADTFIRGGSYQDTSYGNSSVINVKADSSLEYVREAFLRFPRVDGREFVKATLQLRVADSMDTDMTLVVRVANSDPWIEAGEGALTWSNTPEIFAIEESLPGEAWRGPIRGTMPGDYLTLDITDGLQTWLAANPTADSVTLQLYSTTPGSQKVITFDAREGAVYASDEPSIQYQLTTYPRPATILMLK